MELYITPEDNKEFQIILTELEAEKTLLSKKLAEVAAFGGSFPAGIPEYAAIENQIGIIDSQMNGILKALDKYVVTSEEKIPADVIGIYSRITLSKSDEDEGEEYYLLDINLAKTKNLPKELTVITPFSPLGNALLGKKKNEVVSVSLPKGIVNYEVINIKKEVF